MFKPGDTPVPGYQLIQFLGQGAYGEVWEAKAPGGTHVALKFIPLQTAAGGVELKSANSVKLIRHAHLIPITAIWVLDRDGNLIDDEMLDEIESHIKADLKKGKTPTPEQMKFKKSLAYLVIAMALADESLESQLERYQEEGADGIPQKILLEYIREAAKGLDFLNEPRHLVDGKQVGIVHRDVKPANLLLLGDSVVVGDFGLATSIRDFDDQATELVGSLGFMAPESIERHPTPTTDQYALAITYYHLRTGKMPYGDDHSFDSLAQVHKEGRLEFDHVTPDEQKVLKNATAVDPQKRYKTCLEFVEALASASQQSVGGPVKKASIVPMLMGSLALVIALIGGWWALTGNGQPAPPPANGGNETPIPVVAKRSVKISFDPPTTPFELKILSDGKSTTVANTGQASVELADDDLVEVTAKSDSMFLKPYHATLTVDEIVDMGGHIVLAEKTVADVRRAAFDLANEGKLTESLDLLTQAGKENPSALDFPLAQQTKLDHDVNALIAGVHDASYLVLARDDENRTLFRFAKPIPAPATNQVSTNEQTGPASTIDWIDSDLKNVRTAFQFVEPNQWLILRDDSIGIVDAKTKYHELWQSQGGKVSTAAISATGQRLAIGENSGRVNLWQLTMDGRLDDGQKLDLHKESVHDLRFSADEQSLLSVSLDRTLIRLSLPPQGDQIDERVLETSDDFKNQEIVGTAAPSKLDRVIVATESNLFRTEVDLETLVPLGAIELSDPIISVRSSPKSKWILIETDSVSNPLHLIDTETLEDIDISASLAPDSFAAAAFSHDGQTIAISNYRGDLALIDLTGPKPRWQRLPNSESSYRKHLAFVRGDHFLVSILDDNTEEVWQMDQSRLILQSRIRAAEKE